jgi:DNA-binding MarR family transcriptional regulator
VDGDRDLSDAAEDGRGRQRVTRTAAFEVAAAMEPSRFAEDALSGISPARLSALSVLVYGGARTIGEVAAAEQAAAPTLTRLISGLGREGLVSRRSDPRDSRLVRVESSARSKELLEAARRRRLQLLKDRLAELDQEEWVALKKTINTLEHVLKE